MQLPFLVTKSSKIQFSPVLRVQSTIPDLQKFIPENSIDYILGWFKATPIHLRASKARSSKFGDYRAPLNNFPARISVNRNLNRFDFLITLVHEMAHHEVWIETAARNSSFRVHHRKHHPRPHGKEWKTHYRRLMEPLMKGSIFPPEVLHHLVTHFEDPASSSRSNKHLVLALKKYDTPDNTMFLESLPFDAIFSIPAGRKFKKQEKLRKRYRCICINNGRTYLFNPLAKVLPLPPL
jgi:hypothetical protein